MATRTASTALAVLLITGSALAQTGTAMVEIADDVTVAPFSMTVDQLDDMDIHDASGNKIGEVEEILGQSADAPSALTVDFDDAAGYGDRDDVIVPIDQFRLDGDRLILQADAAAIATMPVWDD